MTIHKSFGLDPNFCCMRTNLMAFDHQGNKLGHIEDPWRCCAMDQKIYDTDGNQIFGAEGSICQIGIFLPCCGAVEFDLTDANGQPSDGKIAKIFGGCGEIMAGTNKFRINFPTGATAAHKMILLANTMMIDFQYFEKQKKGGGMNN